MTAQETYAPHPLYRHLRHEIALKMVLAAFLIYWIVMLQALLGQASATQAAARALTLPAMIVMYWIASSKASELSRTLRVLGQIQAPHALRRAQIGKRLRAIGAGWLFLATGACMQLALPASGVSAISGAALVSLAGCVGVLRALAGAGLLPVLARYLLDAAPLLLVMAVVVLGQNRPLGWFGNLPVAALFLLVLSMPVLLASLGTRWSKALPAYRWAPPAPRHRVAAWFESHNRRITLLTMKQNWEAASEHKMFSPEGPLARLAMIAGPVLFALAAPAWEDGRINSSRGTILAITVVWVSGGLVARDLHWRSMLLPGGLRRDRIGMHLWKSTVSLQLALLAGIALIGMAAARLGFGASWEAIAMKLLAYASMPIEMCVVTGAAVLLRATRNSGAATGLLYSIGVMIMLAAPLLLVAFAGRGVVVSFWAYASGMIAATAAMLALANRYWTTRKLFAAAASTSA